MVHVTKHGSKRVRKRSGINKKAVNRMADKAFKDGLKHCETSGRLNKWVTKLYFSNESANNIRIYGDKVYIFAGKTLITMMQVPSNLMSVVFSDKSRKQSKLEEVVGV